jgi:hypothetical protein
MPPTTTRRNAGSADRATNEKVLKEFRAGLFRSGLSEKVVDRDLTNVSGFAEHLLGRPEPQSVREFGGAGFQEYVAHLRASSTLKDTERRQHFLSLKRFIRFLGETERIDQDMVAYALDILRSAK